MVIDCNKIFIVLGSECNMGCKYCIQHPLVHKQQPPKLNMDVIEWLDKMANLRDKKLEVVFYGGEPLLYFGTIRRFIGYSRSKNIQYCVITNGRALTEDMVNFFNAYNVQVTVSWDGKNVKETRGYDVFDRALPHKEILFKMEHLGISGVISAKNYPLDILKAVQNLDNEYFPIHKEHILVNLGCLFGVNIPDPSLANVDYAKLNQQIKSIIAEYDDYLKGGNADPCLIQWMESKIYDYVLVKKYGPSKSPYCRNGYSVLNVDPAGNLYLCHNTRNPLGTIKTSAAKYLSKVMAAHKNEAAWRDKCSACSAYSLCNQYCLLIPDKYGEEHWCKLRRSVLTPIVDYFEGRN